MHTQQNSIHGERRVCGKNLLQNADQTVQVGLLERLSAVIKSHKDEKGSGALVSLEKTEGGSH